MDNLTTVQRRHCMSRIKSKDTKPEMIVRRLIHSLGFRYRLHSKNLPGSPDLVFSKRRKVIFVHGCFWHQHKKCSRSGMPRSKESYWWPKLLKNMERDGKSIEALHILGWKVLVIWECQASVTSHAKLAKRIQKFLCN